MKIKLLLLALCGIILFACSEVNEIDIQTNEPDITGFWINQNYSDTLITYERASELKEDQYCFSFQSDGIFLERKNAGWCATPPIAYANYEGSWTLNDSIIEVSVEFWGGIADLKWKVNSVNNQKLSITVIEENYPVIN